MSKLRAIFCIFSIMLLTSCSKHTSYSVADNMYKIMLRETFLTEEDYKNYIKDLDYWAVGEAYDNIVTLPDSLRSIDYDIDTPNTSINNKNSSDEDLGEEEYMEPRVSTDGFNIYACFQDVDLEEFSNFYLFDSDEYFTNTEGGEGDVVDQSKTWDVELIKRFNPNKEHNVKNAVCYIGYGYYTLKYGNTEFRYYLAVKCNKEGKVEKYIQNYLGT